MMTSRVQGSEMEEAARDAEARAARAATSVSSLFLGKKKFSRSVDATLTEWSTRRDGPPTTTSALTAIDSIRAFRGFGLVRVTLALGPR